MRCHVCDKALSEAEIQVSPSGAGYEPCSICLEIALDAAYCDGFVRGDDDLDSDEEYSSVETLESDVNVSSLDSEYQLSWIYDDE